MSAKSTVHSDSNVANGTRYHYVVRSYDSSGKESASSAEVSAIADTVNPAASLSSAQNGEHYSGSGPARIQGQAMDAASGVKEVKIGIRRNDTSQWWGKGKWQNGPALHRARLDVSGPRADWEVETGDVVWAQATGYLLFVEVRDHAGFVLSPAATSTFFIDTPPVLKSILTAAPSAVTEGQDVQVTILIANAGGTEAAGIEPQIPRSRGTAILKLQGEGKAERIPSLAPGDFATVSWTFFADKAGSALFEAGAAGRNTATGETINAERVASNEIFVRRPARLKVTVTPRPANVRQGADLTIRMRIANEGDAAARVTSVSLEPLRSKIIGQLNGPNPSPPFVLEGKESRELVWTASAAGTGEVAFKGEATGIDATSGAAADASPATSSPVGLAGRPSAIDMAASVGSAVVESRVALTAILRDESGTPVPDTPVSFGLLAGGGSLEAGSAVTDENGKAQVELKLGESAGICTIQAKAGALLAAATVESVLPGGISQYLSRNYFDPSKGETVEVDIYVPRVEMVRVRILSIAGEVVRDLAEEKVKAGNTRYAWNGRDDRGVEVPNGVYFFSVQAGSNLLSRRVSVLKR